MVKKKNYIVGENSRRGSTRRICHLSKLEIEINPTRHGVKT